jgi:hypothetical protein
MKPALVIENPGAIVRTWSGMAARNPGVAVHHWQCLTAFVWKAGTTALCIGPTIDAGMVAPNHSGLRAASLAPGLDRVLTDLVRYTSRPGSGQRIVFWQPATALYVTLGALLIALVRACSFAPILAWLSCGLSSPSYLP